MRASQPPWWKDICHDLFEQPDSLEATFFLGGAKKNLLSYHQDGVWGRAVTAHQCQHCYALVTIYTAQWNAASIGYQTIEGSQSEFGCSKCYINIYFPNESKHFGARAQAIRASQVERKLPLFARTLHRASLFVNRLTPRSLKRGKIPVAKLVKDSNMLQER